MVPSARASLTLYQAICATTEPILYHEDGRVFNVAVQFVSDSLSLHLKLPESPEVKHPLCNAGLVVRLKEIRELQINLALSIA